MTIIFAIAAFGGAGFVLLWTLSGSRQVPVGPELTNTYKQELQASGFQRVMLPVLSKLGRHIVRMLPPGRIQALRRRIILGGKQMTWNVEKAMALKALGTIVGVAAAFALLSYERSVLFFVLAALIVGIGYFSVDYYLDKAAGVRQTEIQQSLPDVLDQVSVWKSPALTDI